jgi:predicted CXXCH cytochrome family protein
MGCHDDKGDGPPVKVEGRGLLRHGSGRVNHPIGVRYEAYQSYGGFRAASRVAREVLMPGGRVGCVSCHRGYSERHGALVRSNKGSALCFECHDL